MAQTITNGVAYAKTISTGIRQVSITKRFITTFGSDGAHANLYSHTVSYFADVKLGW